MVNNIHCSIFIIFDLTTNIMTMVIMIFIMVMVIITFIMIMVIITYIMTMVIFIIIMFDHWAGGCT